MPVIEVLAYTLCAAGIIGAAIPLIPEQIWWLRAWTYPRVQMALINTGLLMLFLLLVGVTGAASGLIAIGLILTIMLCLRDILPFMPYMPKQSPDLTSPDSGASIKMVLGNVLMENENASELLVSIRRKNPDLVFMVETNAKWRGYLSELEAEYPYTYLLPLEDFNGMLFYSRYEILNVSERYLVQDHIPSLSIDLKLGQQTVRFFGVHPRPPRPEDDTEKMDRELDIIAAEAKDCPHPVIVSGDLNDVGWSAETKSFLQTSGLLDPRRGRGLFNTFNAKNPIVRWPLDHLFHSQHFGTIAIERLPKFGSDHFPMFVHLGLKIGVSHD